MRSFLGVPVKAGGRVYGNLYLTEKHGGVDFDADDERALTLLAAQAGAAIEAANLYEQATDRAQRLEAIRAVTTAILTGTDTGQLLELIVAHARTLADADVATLTLPDEGEVVADGQAAEAGPAVAIPLTVRGRTLGTLTVANARDRPPVREGEVQLVAAFADQAAVALDYARLQGQLQRLAVLEDRERIAKELHDGAIQALFAVGMGLQGAALLAPTEELRGRLQNAVEELDRVIRDLRNYIFGLRPGILADRHLDQALHQLVDEFGQRSGVLAIAEIDPQVAAELTGRAADVVQLAREALSNVGRHAEAATCRISLYRTEAGAVLEVDDDGQGFDPTQATSGQGLGNLHDRAKRLGGTAEIHSTPGQGTQVRITIPH